MALTSPLAQDCVIFAPSAVPANPPALKSDEDEDELFSALTFPVA
jgi:hypothetical protein